MIDAFGHNGHRPRKRFNVVGTMGKVVILRDRVREITLTTYCHPQEGAVHTFIPLHSLMARLVANEPSYHDFAVPTSRGAFNSWYEWIALRP